MRMEKNISNIVSKQKVVELPTNIIRVGENRTSLEVRLEETRKMLEKSKQSFHPDPEKRDWSLLYKVILLQELLDVGEINLPNFSMRLNREYNGVFYPEKFNQAFAGVESFIKSIGEKQGIHSEAA